jgi:hypothetical protein
MRFQSVNGPLHDQATLLDFVLPVAVRRSVAMIAVPFVAMQSRISEAVDAAVTKKEVIWVLYEPTHSS